MNEKATLVKEEIEIVEFCLGKGLFAINVEEIREIVKMEEDLLNENNAQGVIEGIINLRGDIVPTVNLAKYLNVNNNLESGTGRVIISEVEGNLLGLWVGEVNGIHRILREEVERASEMIVNSQEVVKIDDKIIFLVNCKEIIEDLIRK